MRASQRNGEWSALGRGGRESLGASNRIVMAWSDPDIFDGTCWKGWRVKVRP
jgi:hypothetical protein